MVIEWLTSLSRRFFGCRRQQGRVFQNIEQSILEQHEADERGPGDGNKGDEDRADLVIMGSGSIIPPLAQQGLIDEYQIVVIPVRERMFDGIGEKLTLTLTKTRSFGNGNVLRAQGLKREFQQNCYRHAGDLTVAGAC